MIILFKCDADKNTECRKRGCYKRGGKCRMTKNPDLAVKNEKTGQPIIGYMRFEGAPPLIDDRET